MDDDDDIDGDIAAVANAVEKDNDAVDAADYDFDDVLGGSRFGRRANAARIFRCFEAEMLTRRMICRRSSSTSLWGPPLTNELEKKKKKKKRRMPQHGAESRLRTSGWMKEIEEKIKYPTRRLEETKIETRSEKSVFLPFSETVKDRLKEWMTMKWKWDVHEEGREDPFD